MNLQNLRNLQILVSEMSRRSDLAERDHLDPSGLDGAGAQGVVHSCKTHWQGSRRRVYWLA